MHSSISFRKPAGPNGFIVGVSIELYRPGLYIQPIKTNYKRANHILVS